jgi:hypothetical protein
MGATKHEKTFVDFEKPYEQNLIGLKGIVYFGVGLFLLIVITFGLMWIFLVKMEDEFRAEKASTNPLQMTDSERLPPEPRLQVAPGFKFSSEHSQVNLELKAPQAEYWAYKKYSDDILAHGEKDKATGTMIAMPVEQAKEIFLKQTTKARSGPQADKTYKESHMIISDATSGRRATEKRR